MSEPSPLYTITSYIDRHGGTAGTLRTLVSVQDDVLTLTFRTACGKVRRWVLPLTSAQEFVQALDEVSPALPPPRRR